MNGYVIADYPSVILCDFRDGRGSGTVGNLLFCMGHGSCVRELIAYLEAIQNNNFDLRLANDK